MSRRAPDPAAERAARNAQTIKALLKLEGNKNCADCKKNKHPRWASWNLGIFICIRCSGIHRGMGTHISRVKSVDLDSWTDEQLKSVVMWGNARANKYWEAKLAPGHVPSEAKIENFIRTKYEAKRWVMDGPIPDPSTLDEEGDDDVPLSIIKEKQEIARANSLRQAPQSSSVGPSAVRRAPQPDLFANDSAQQRSSSGPPPAVRHSKPESAPPPPQAKPQRAGDSLLGLDFFAQDAPAPPRSSSAAPTSGIPGQSRPDLKQSILSLYASAPKPQPTQHQSRPSVSNGQASNNSFGGLDDFAGLSFTSTTSPPPQVQKQDAFADFGGFSRPTTTSPPAQSFGGSFFDTRPKPQPQAANQHSRTMSSSSGFGSFGSPPPIPAAAPAPKPVVKSSGMNDLFDFATPTTSAPAPKPVTSPQPSSVFNLTPAQPAPKAQPAPAATTSSGWGSNFDAFGTNDAWGSTSPQPPKPAPAPVPVSSGLTNDFGWGSATSTVTSPPLTSSIGGFGQSSGFGQPASTPKVDADEEFGGWSSAPAPAPVTKTTTTKPTASFAVDNDLFSNVWQ